MITQARLKKLVRYDPATGQFAWRQRQGNRRANSLAGVTNAAGYVVIRADRMLYYAHRLAWLYMTGNWPCNQIDHVNMSRTDNRWSNLREATHTQNFGNVRPRSSRSGLKGIWWDRERRLWGANIQVYKTKHFLGRFDCPAAAHLAYVVGADKYFGEFARAQ